MRRTPLRQGLIIFVVILAGTALLEYFDLTNMGFAWGAIYAVVFAGWWIVVKTIKLRLAERRTPPHVEGDVDQVDVGE